MLSIAFFNSLGSIDLLIVDQWETSAVSTQWWSLTVYVSTISTIYIFDTHSTWPNGMTAHSVLIKHQYRVKLSCQCGESQHTVNNNPQLVWSEPAAAHRWPSEFGNIDEIDAKNKQI